jgi:hypothetical protein
MKARTPASASARPFNSYLTLGLIAAGLLFLHSSSVNRATARPAAESRLTAHEWGTFTSIAGPDGRAMTWLPLTGSTDLPSFVEHLGNVNFKGGLRGTIRLETPVLYFYSRRETTVSVHATFSKGLFTEWYPHASVRALDPRRDLLFPEKQTEGAITWSSVRIEPAGADDFPTDTPTNHYFAARGTLSAPLSVDSDAGGQREKFLFYRGASAIPLPFSATVCEASLLLQNHFAAPIPDAILFEKRGKNLGYRILGPISDQVSFAPPALTNSRASLDSLFSYLEGLLISEGLYTDEAHAMLETWKDSWFEEGSRILYIVPRAFVDSALPLTITPAPVQLNRVFVGRVELITPATQQAVESAFASGSRAALARYSRFLEPILSAMIQSSPDPVRRRRLADYLDSAYMQSYRSQTHHRGSRGPAGSL